MSDQQADDPALILNPALSDKLANALKGQDTTAYSPAVRQLAQQLLFGENEGHYGIWEDAPEQLRATYLKEAARRLQG